MQLFYFLYTFLKLTIEAKVSLLNGFIAGRLFCAIQINFFFLTAQLETYTKSAFNINREQLSCTTFLN